MDREYLEDYEEKEWHDFRRLWRRIQDGKFSFETDKYPSNERFVKLQNPVAMTSYETANIHNLWAQIPFCGSLILLLPPWPQDVFERVLFKTSRIARVIDFIKETGKLQVALNHDVRQYQGLDHLDAFFKELNLPVYFSAPHNIFGNEKEIRNALNTFDTLAKVKYLSFLRETQSSRYFSTLLDNDKSTYVTLKLGRYSIVEDIENSLIDDPRKASSLIDICDHFIVSPIRDLLSTQRNFTLQEIREARTLPLIYQPHEPRFPYEIGEFLLKKLTYAAQDMRACYNLIDDYDAYDLQKVQESLNKAIVANHPDIIDKNTEDVSEILDNIWNDPMIPRRIKNLKRGVPVSIAAIGTAVSAFTGGLEGFLAGLGFSVGAKFLEAELEELSEGIVRFFARSYQANVYGFKKKYEDKIVKPRQK